MGSGRSTPSTHPSGTRLVRCWVRHLSIRSLGESFSTSSEVNSTRADRVDTSMSAFLLLFKGMTSPRGVANRNSRLQWVTCKLPLGAFISYEGTPFATWHITSYSTSLHRSFTFLFPWNASAFFNTVSRHQLNCACSSIIVAFLSVRFTVRLVLGFSIGFFEAR